MKMLAANETMVAVVVLVGASVYAMVVFANEQRYILLVHLY